jgi:hypothetical protein
VESERSVLVSLFDPIAHEGADADKDEHDERYDKDKRR